MQTIQNTRLDPPTTWQDFEHLCWLLWHDVWNDPGTQKNGRQGHKQNGVDVIGQPKKGYWAGVQCKGKDNYRKKRVTERELHDEVLEATHFIPPLSEFILATTGSRDAKIQECARRITADHQEAGLFSVRVCAWDDIRDLLGRHPNVVSEFYIGEAFAKDSQAYIDKFCAFINGLHAKQQEERQKEIESQTLTLTQVIRFGTAASRSGEHTKEALSDISPGQVAAVDTQRGGTTPMLL